MGQIIQVDPATLILPSSRQDGVDMMKLHQQIRQFGYDALGMPPVLVQEAPDGTYVILNGVTRATRMARYRPGVTIPVEIFGVYRGSTKGLATVKEKL